MLSSLVFVAFGLAMLVGGGELLLRGAVSIARLAKISPAVVGLTVVAAATSIPEMAVSLAAAIRGSSDIAVGNVVGSNIANIGLILGVSAVLAPLAIERQMIRLDYPFLVLVSVLLLAVSADGLISRIEGTIFVLMLIGYYSYLVALTRRQNGASGVNTAVSDGQLTLLRTILFTGLGVVLLSAGAEATVHGAIMAAQILGVSDRIIGLTVVAVGTSLPELVASTVSAVRGRGDIAVGNVVGSNIFNILGILGVTGIVKPITVSSLIIASDNWWMLGFALLLFPLMRSQMKISRGEGVFLVLVYSIYTVLLIQGT